jgi:hypothetical protein
VYVLITQVNDATLTHLLDLEQFEVTGYESAEKTSKRKKRHVVQAMQSNVAQKCVRAQNSVLYAK